MISNKIAKTLLGLVAVLALVGAAPIAPRQQQSHSEVDVAATALPFDEHAHLAEVYGQHRGANVQKHDFPAHHGLVWVPIDQLVEMDKHASLTSQDDPITSNWNDHQQKRDMVMNDGDTLFPRSTPPPAPRKPKPQPPPRPISPIPMPGPNPLPSPSPSPPPSRSPSPSPPSPSPNPRT